MAAAFAARFKTRTRDEWAVHFVGTDACVTPVLTFAEAPLHPHNVSRASYMEVGGLTQAAPAPRFADAVTAASAAETMSPDEAIARWS